MKMVDSQELDMRLDAIDLLMLNLEDFSDYNQTYQDGEKEQEERRSRVSLTSIIQLHPIVARVFFQTKTIHIHQNGHSKYLQTFAKRLHSS